MLLLCLIYNRYLNGMGWGSTARPLAEHVWSHRFNLWHHIYRTWWHSPVIPALGIEKDQKFKAIYRTHQVGDKPGHIRHRLFKNKTTTNIWKIKTIHVSVRVYIYAGATVPVVDCKGSENSNSPEENQATVTHPSSSHLVTAFFTVCKCFRGWTMCDDLTGLGKWLSG